jgi:hypothetical protein
MKNKKMKQLSEFEHILLWMATRYAVGRTSIASAMLPADIIRNWGNLLTERDRKLMFRDIVEHFDDRIRFAKGEPTEDIDQNSWIKFASWLDETNRYTVEAEIDGKSETHECFLFMGRYYPVRGLDWWVSGEFIVSSTRKVESTRWAEEVRHDGATRGLLSWLFDQQKFGHCDRVSQ